MKKGKKSPVRVMVVDDEENILKSIEVYLKMEGFEVVAASDGEKALKMLKSLTPDIIVLDLMMPVIDGYGVITRLREKKEWSSIPVIILTACGQDSDVLKGYRSGASCYMTKPFNLNELVDNINLIVSSHVREEDKIYRI